MKHSRLFLAALLAVIASVCSGQELKVNFSTTVLPAHISDWSSNPGLITFLVIPGAGGLEIQDAHIIIDVSNSAGKILASTRTKFAEQPPLTAVLTATQTYRWPEIFNPNAVTIDASIKASTERSGMLPEGSYELCASVVAQNGQPMPQIKQGCATFRVLQLEPPRLLLPASNAKLNSTDALTFAWTPVNGYPTPLRYELRMYEVLPGQTPGQAAASNQVFYEAKNLNANTLLYPTSAPSLKTSSRNLAWQVQAVDDAGNPVGKNNGMSAVALFTVKTLTTAAGNGCACGCGGTPRPYCAHANCKCAQARQIIGDSAVAVGRGNSCNCGCGGTPRPGCAYKGCVCAKTNLILRDNTGVVTAASGTDIAVCACGCGGTPRPTCAHKDCACAKTGVVKALYGTDNTEVSSCSCGCGGTPRPTCAHKDCACAKTGVVKALFGVDNTDVSACGCGCGGTPRPTCAHKDCACAKTGAVRTMFGIDNTDIAACGCGCGGTPIPACAHRDCVCAKAGAVEGVTTPGTSKGNGCECGCGGTPRPSCAHKDCKCAKN